MASRLGSSASPVVNVSRFTGCAQKVEDVVRQAVLRLFVSTNTKGKEGPVVQSSPSAALELLYKILFGERWRSNFPHLPAEASISSIDVTMALVGAALHAEVLSLPPRHTYRSSLNFPSDVHERCMKEVLKKYGRTLET